MHVLGQLFQTFWDEQVGKDAPKRLFNPFKSTTQTCQLDRLLIYVLQIDDSEALCKAHVPFINLCGTYLVNVIFAAIIFWFKGFIST